ncbi:ATP-binding protein [Heyndrickxia camelliae]|uniref:histidine kinase n=1 Tax=Heyndrickxia camelliae TaxID=1707093 RepID=A0A2N3LJE1_9BACI|nr:ATP-binding protein [Heyndrickxia camelliae]PKR84748.1 PAS domain-containing sensor histidine kinase [Heyndrickxia camelliae]
MGNRRKIYFSACCVINLVILFLDIGCQLVISAFFRNASWFLEVMMLLLCFLLVYILFWTYRFYFLYKEYCHLEDEEEKWSLLMQATPDFICFKDGKGRWKKVNKFGRKLYQLESIDYVGKTDLELAELVPFFKDGLNSCYLSDEEVWRAGKLTRIEESFIVPSGEIKSFDVIKIPLYYENGLRKGLLTIGRDITQQKVAESILIKREKLSVVGELAAGIAHEIRNPLTSIKGLTQLMWESGNITEDYAKVMVSEIDRINQIAGGLLALSKPQSAEMDTVLLNEILQYVVNIMEPESLLKDIQINMNMEESVCKIQGNRNGLIQVFINLLKNAMDAMPNGGQINITSRRVLNKIHIIVSDQGVGIPSERLEKIGEPFFTLKEKGMGLGLTISYKIIQDHKGTFEFSSQEGCGTDVVIKLPC